MLSDGGGPQRGRPLAPTDLTVEVGLHQLQVVGMGHADAARRRWAAPRRVTSPSDVGHHFGQQHFGLLGGLGAASMASCNALWNSGVKPHRFIDTRASGDSSAGSRPSAGREAAVAERR